MPHFYLEIQRILPTEQALKRENYADISATHHFVTLYLWKLRLLGVGGGGGGVGVEANGGGGGGNQVV